jgi:hypothetical protein
MVDLRSVEIHTKHTASFCELRVWRDVHLVGKKVHKQKKSADPKSQGNRSDYANCNLMIFRVFEAFF